MKIIVLIEITVKQLTALQFTKLDDSYHVIVLRQHQALKVICNELKYHIL